MNYEAARSFELHRESLACGDYEREPPEITDEHLATAVDDYAAKQPAEVLEFLDNCTWFKEHVMEIVQKCPGVRKALMQTDDVQIAAQKLANEEERRRREQNEQDRVEAAFED
jgi:hypothetical protein